MYLGEDGERHPIVMGSYGIGLGRNVACIVEAHHDDKGIVWPAEVAPYAAHLVAIGANKRAEVTEIAEGPRRRGRLAEHEILYDDRDESPGVKFTDAELLGMPWILTVSPRSLAAGGVEVTERATGEQASARSRTSRRSSGPGADARLSASAGASSHGRPAGPRRRPLRHASSWRPTPRPRRSSSPGGPCSSATTPTWPARAPRRSTARSGSTSPTTGCATRTCGRATTASASGSARPARPRRTGVRHPRPPRAGRRAGAPPHRRAGPRRSTRPDLVRGDPAERLRGSWTASTRLTPDELDRLAAAEPPPIAFLATVRRFLPRTPRAAFAAAERQLAARVPRDRWTVVGLREGLLGVAAELVLRRSSMTCSRSRSGAGRATACCGPGRRRSTSRATARTAPGGSGPRPGGDPHPRRASAFLRASQGIAGDDRPWPAALDRDEDEALRISALLAAGDVAAALRPTAWRPRRGPGPAARRRGWAT